MRRYALSKRTLLGFNSSVALCDPALPIFMNATMSRFLQLAILVLLLVTGNFAFCPRIPPPNKYSFTRLYVELKRGASLTPRPPREPPIDIENNPAVSFSPQPPLDPPTDIANNPAVVVVTMEESKESKRPVGMTTPGYFYFTEELSAATKLKHFDEISVENISSDDKSYEEFPVVTLKSEIVATTQSPVNATTESQNEKKEEYNDLGVLAESIGKVAFGGSKAAILGIKAFVDIMSSP